MQSRLLLFIFIALMSMQGDCKKGNGPDPAPPEPPQPPAPVTSDVDYWMTLGDQSALLQKQSTVLKFGTTANSFPNITVDTTQRFQEVDGFGYTLTSGSASLLRNLSAAARATLLAELFGTASNSISISYLRVSIGASDLSANVYSYNDMPAGQTDPTLANFSLNPDGAAGTGLIPVLKEILAINPAIKILGSPWSPPTWMKDNNNSKGGSLLPQYYSTYAQYFVKYVQQMGAEGITIDAITPQNEPLHPGNNPSMFMSAEQQADFVKNHLGPAFRAANISTKIIVYDHNCDKPEYPITILDDAAARDFVDGSAFHLYAGDISALSTVHNKYPDKAVYFTEQWTSSAGDFAGDLKWHLKNVIIGSMRNWSRNALEWNLANDQSFGPHTDGGCTQCKGALTIGASITRNVSYYIIAHASKFVPAGSVRVASNVSGNLHSVAFETPQKKKVLIVVNDGGSAATFNIKFRDKWVTPSLPAGAVATYVW